MDSPTSSPWSTHSRRRPTLLARQYLLTVCEGNLNLLGSCSHLQRNCRSSGKVLNLQIVLHWFGGAISPVAKCWTTNAGPARCGRRLAMSQVSVLA
jgi:hypothetical protein